MDIEVHKDAFIGWRFSGGESVSVLRSPAVTQLLDGAERSIKGFPFVTSGHRPFAGLFPSFQLAHFLCHRDLGIVTYALRKSYKAVG